MNEHQLHQLRLRRFNKLSRGDLSLIVNMPHAITGAIVPTEVRRYANTAYPFDKSLQALTEVVFEEQTPESYGVDLAMFSSTLCTLCWVVIRRGPQFHEVQAQLAEDFRRDRRAHVELTLARVGDQLAVKTDVFNPTPRVVLH